MAWFSGKVSLGNFPDFAGAVNKLSESVKNMEKNFDSALGLEEKSDASSSGNEASGALWPSAMDRKALFEPIMGFMGQKDAESTAESLEQPDILKPTSPLKDKEVKDDGSADHSAELANEEIKKAGVDAEPGEEIKYRTRSKKITLMQVKMKRGFHLRHLLKLPSKIVSILKQNRQTIFSKILTIYKPNLQTIFTGRRNKKKNHLLLWNQNNQLQVL